MQNVMASGQSSELPRLVALIKTLTIPQLKDLLRNEGLPVSGLKASLQLRIIDCMSCSPLESFVTLPTRFVWPLKGTPPRGHEYYGNSWLAPLGPTLTIWRVN